MSAESGRDSLPQVSLQCLNGASPPAAVVMGWRSLAGFSELFQRNVMASGVVPQISSIFGPCAGGAVYSPALTDFVVMVQEKSYMFLTGPKVVKATINEDVTVEALGGAAMHSSRSGVSDYAAVSEEDAITYIRRLLSFLPQNNLENPPTVECTDSSDRMIEDLNGIVPENPNAAYDMKEVILHIVDNRDFFEIKENFAPNIIVGFARFNGMAVGIVANQPNYHYSHHW